MRILSRGGLKTIAWLYIALVLSPLSALADGLPSAEIYFLGEQHDNPWHHQRQSELVGMLAPTSLVFEMLTKKQAAQVTPDLIGKPEELAHVLGWADSGWPDFAMYHPIFAAMPNAFIYGAAVPREKTRQLMSADLASVFGATADDFGLGQDLPKQQQQQRQALQAAAHCDALPENMLPMMVNVQRFRDAAIAKAALDAFNAHGAPVVVITGNGHARTDWGAPAALRQADPDVVIFSLGQGEHAFGAPEGTFDSVEIGADVDRGDPCDAFR